jgi:glycosyltransferase involved in cell wall biosynthesis
VDGGRPLVSVIVCNHNYGGYVGEAIDSVFAQDYPEIELIVIDDGSTDDSREVIAAHTRGRENVRLHEQENRGIVPTRNLGLELAAGEFYLFLDSDNVLPPGYVSALVERAGTGFDVVYPDLEMFGDEHFTREYPEFDLEEFKVLSFVDSASLVRRAAIGDQRFDERLNRLTHEDYDFFLGLALRGLRFRKGGVALKYRVHDKSRNGNHDSFGKHMADFLMVYQYIIGKYAVEFPEQFDDQFEKELQFQFGRLGDTIDVQGAVIAARDAELADLKASSAYRLGRAATAPARLLRGLLRR